MVGRVLGVKVHCITSQQNRDITQQVVSIPGADQKDRSLWERDWQQDGSMTKKKGTRDYALPVLRDMFSSFCRPESSSSPFT